MKLSFSTNAFTGYTAAEAVRKIASVGYAGVEILADVPHIFMDDIDITTIEDVRRAVVETGIEVSNINANTVRGYCGYGPYWDPLLEPSLSSPDEQARRWRIEYTKRCVELSRELDCQNVSVTSGHIYPGSTPEEGTAHLKASLSEIALYAEENGVRIGVEYEPGLLIEYSSELRALIDGIPSAYIGANLDLGHSHCVGEDPETVFERLNDRVFHVHLEDIKGRVHFHLIPGLGDMDFARLFSLHRKYNYNGFITVELYTYSEEPEAAARKAYEYLERLL